MKTINKNLRNLKAQELNQKEIKKIVGGTGEPDNTIVPTSTTDPASDPINSNRGGFAVSGRNNT